MRKLFLILIMLISSMILYATPAVYAGFIINETDKPITKIYYSISGNPYTLSVNIPSHTEFNISSASIPVQETDLSLFLSGVNDQPDAGFSFCVFNSSETPDDQGVADVIITNDSNNPAHYFCQSAVGIKRK